MRLQREVDSAAPAFEQKNTYDHGKSNRSNGCAPRPAHSLAEPPQQRTAHQDWDEYLEVHCLASTKKRSVQRPRPVLPPTPTLIEPPTRTHVVEPSTIINPGPNSAQDRVGAGLAVRRLVSCLR